MSYTFIEEKVVPSKQKKFRKILLKVLLTVVLAILFGAVACVTFYACKDKVAEYFGVDGQTEDEKGQTDPIRLSGPQAESSDEDSQAAKQSETESNNEAEASGDEIKQEENTDGEKTDTDGDIGDETEPGTDAADGEEPAEDPATEQPQTIIVDRRVAAEVSDLENVYKNLSSVAYNTNKSIVRVSSVVSSVDWFQNPYETELASSGVVAAEDSHSYYLLTSNAHVTDANEIRVTFANGESVPGTLHDYDEQTGMYVLTINKGDVSGRTANSIRIAQFGESYLVAEGDPVMAVGRPNGYMYSMLVGIVTNKSQYANVTDGRYELFFTDIHSYSDGDGVIINTDGDIVGLITKKFGSDEVCSALAISRVKNLIEKLINKEARTYFGVVAADLTESMREKIGDTGAVYVSAVEEGSPAARAGIRVGDVIFMINEDNVSSTVSYSIALGRLEPNAEARVQIGRLNRSEFDRMDLAVRVGQTGME